ISAGVGDTDNDAFMTLNGTIMASTGISISSPSDIILGSESQTTGTLSITSTNGSIRDDGNDGTFIQAPNISLTAHGDIGGNGIISVNDVLTQSGNFLGAIDFDLLGGTLTIAQTAPGNIQLRKVNGAFQTSTLLPAGLTPAGTGKQLALLSSGGNLSVNAPI